MSERYINSDFLDGLVVWQKSPEDEPITVNGEEGIPYFSPNGRPRLAIIKNGQILDAVSIDITIKKVTSDDEVGSQNNQVRIERWDNYTPRLMVKPGAVKKAIEYGARLRKIGWTDERLQFELRDIAHSLADPNTTGQSVAAICIRNRLSPQRDDIPMLAMAACEYCQGVGSQKGFLVHMKGKSEEEIADFIVRLSLYIALLNPCLGKPWDRGHVRQGMRRNDRAPSELEATLASLLDRLAYMQAQADHHDDYEEWFGDEVRALDKSIKLIQQDVELETQEKRGQLDALQAAKAQLAAMGIPCKTNVIDAEWAQFVAEAWGVTPSQVVSAAKKVGK